MIPVDVIFMIAEKCDWETLENMKLSSNIFYNICQRIQMKRLYSKIPLGEIDAMLKIKINDIMIKSMSIVLNNREYYLDTYRLPYINEILKRWFIFSFFQDDWILTGKIIKSIIRLHNKTHDNKEGDILYFGFYPNGESFLKYIM